MARTPLFASLQRAYRRAIGASPTAPSPSEALRRRQLLLAAAAASAAPVVGCGDDGETTPTPEDEVIVIVGGGMAGLHCAYRLLEAGVKATVYEASTRLGGRMWTARGEFEQAPEQLFELGGELIDSGHETLKALAEEFDLVLDDRLAGDQAPLQQDTWFIDGVAVPDDVVLAQFTEVAPAIAMQVAAADDPEDDTTFGELDATPLNEWIDTNVPIATYPELNKILQVAYRGEYGLENDEQSALNLIYLIGADDPDPFRIFGVSDERFHTNLGNEAFIEKIAEALEPGQVVLEHALTAVTASEGGFELTFDAPEGEMKVNATRVVFALPFTKLREVDLTGVTLEDDKRDAIANLGYGTNAKVMMGFTSRVWKDVHMASGGMTTTLPVQQTWDTTIGQQGAHGILTNFLGGDQGLASGDGTPEAWADGVLPDIEQVWPGVTAAFTGEVARMHWPTVPTMKGSYACYKPGQWAFYEVEGRREGKLHFCGEHCSLDFQGYMEGAAETGALVAAEILDDLEAAKPDGMVKALGLKLVIPQSTYRAGRFPRENPFRRRRRIRAIAAELLASLDR
jgi:monoamine oxidase